MHTAVQEALHTMNENWEKMKKSREEEAEDDANLFEDSFYVLMERVRQWINELESKPMTLEESLVLPEIEQIVSQIPAELYLNFETELDLLLEGVTRTDDAKYDE